MIVDCDSNATIPLTMLIDHFEENLQELTKQDARILFAMSLNQPMKLYKTLQDNPSFEEELTAFFNNAIDHYQTEVLADEDKAQSLQALLFLLEQKQRVLRCAIAAGTPSKVVKEELSKNA